MLDYEDYEEYYDMSKIEEAYQEFIDKVNSLVSDDLKAAQSNIYAEKEKINQEKQNIKIKNSELSIRESDVSKREKEFETNKIKYIKEYLSQHFGFDLKVGQKVWIIDRRYDYIKCPKCNGEKTFSVEKDGFTYTRPCENCKGNGKIDTYKYNIIQDFITQISIRFNFTENNISIDDGSYGGYGDSIIYLESNLNKSISEIYRMKEEAEKELARLT
jgi:hypothetical protein